MPESTKQARAPAPVPAKFSSAQRASVRWVVTLIHLAVWAELGVLTRDMLIKFLTLGCGGKWGPCLGGPIYFSTLTPNMVGSYVIGLFAAASAVGLKADRPLALLPREHAWQENLSLQIGIRTGFCGCLTTFASWNLELMTSAIDHNTWMEAVAGYLIGLYSALMSYVLGIHTALAVDRWVLHRREDVRLEQAEYELGELRYELGLSSRRPQLSAREADLLRMEPDVPREGSVAVLMKGRSAPAAGESWHAEQRLWEELEEQLSSIVEAGGEQQQGGGGAPAPAGNQGGGAAASGKRQGWAVPDSPFLASLSPSQIQLLRRSTRKRGGAAAPAGGDSSGGPPQAEPEDAPAGQGSQQAADVEDGKAKGGGGAAAPPPPFWPQLAAALFGSKTNAAALAGLVLLTAWLITGTALPAQPTWLHNVWLSCLMGIPGCYTRYFLSFLNYRLPGGWDWVPGGTYLANVGGTALTAALQAVIVRASLSYWATVCVKAVQIGYCGGLSTVSTLVAEIYKMLEVFPDRFHAYTYTLASFFSAILMVISLYGWAHWA